MPADTPRPVDSDPEGAERRAATCPSCNAPPPPGARFCPGCGAALDGRPARRGWNATAIAILAATAGIAAAAIIVVFAIDRDPPPASPFPVTGAPSGTGAGTGAGMGSAAAVDLSTMTPRQAADRLFNRIMMASEQGDMAAARRFVPMAVQAYAMVEPLDADAHYHLGLIHATADDFDAARKQVAAIGRLAPDHLLGSVLRHIVAGRGGDGTAASRSYAAFLAAYDAEMAIGRQEYRDHRTTIDNFRAAAMAASGKGN